jgi:GNAT superfamily N-acetyltransferase
VTKPADADGGIPSRSFSQASAAASAAIAAGDVTALVAIWSQPAARMSAAVATGNAPPTTNPKYRGPALATRPGSATATRSASTCSGAFTALFTIATLPAYRGRGYGTAMTARIVADGLAGGAKWSWLQSSPAGYTTYDRLGFRTVESWPCWLSTT